MHKSSSKVLFFLFAITLILLFVACGSESENNIFVYKAVQLTIPDGISALYVCLFDDSAVYFDMDNALIFSDYRGNVLNRIEPMLLSETEYPCNITVDEEKGEIYIQSSENLYTVGLAGNVSIMPTDENPEIEFTLPLPDDTLSTLRDVIDLKYFNENEDELSGVRFLDNGDIICAFRTAFVIRDIIRYTRNLLDTDENIPLDVIPADETLPDEKTTITIYALEIDRLLQNEYINAFNKSSTEYIIETKTFLNDSVDRDVALRNLNTEIIAGNIPDIIIYDNQTSVRDHANSGLLADLYEFMDFDTDFNRDDYLTNAFTASELNGKLYTVFPVFEISTMLARISEVGETPGWTLDEYAAYISGTDATYISAYLDKDIMATSQLEFTTDMSYMLFIDAVTGEPIFDREVFMKLLEIAGHYPRETEDITDIFMGGNIAGANGPLMWIEKIRGFLLTGMIKSFFGEEMVYIGYPGTGGSGSFFVPPVRAAITEQSSNKEGAWEFIKYLLDSYDFQTMGFYPINIENLSQLADRGTTGFRISTSDLDGNNHERIDEYGLVEKEVVLILNAIKSTNRVLLYDWIVTSIIEEELTAYFAGHSNAEQAADAIESKLGIYYAETS